MARRNVEFEESTDRPVLSYALFGLGALSLLIAAGGIIVGSLWVAALGFLGVLVCAGLFWVGALLREE